jgi:hypothetical protein
MRFAIHITTAAALCASSMPAYSKTPPAKTASFQLNGTSWTFTDKKGSKMRESVDADGNYVLETRAGKHVDHGTAVMKDGKACFTSVMTKEGEECWTTKPVKIGQALHTVSNKGEKLAVTRVAYVPLKAPK